MADDERFEAEVRIARARRAFDLAAHNLAASVDVTDRIATDLDYPADRSPRADVLRAEMRVTDLRRYREADAALTAALRNGDCEYCQSSLGECRSEPGTVCCEDCTHPHEPTG